MTSLEIKHEALLQEAERRGGAEVGSLRGCFELLSLALLIDRDCARRLAPHRLSEGKFVVLFLLHDRIDGLSPYELADRAGVTRATITGLLDGLERDGFLARHSHSVDRRKVSVLLTEHGRTLAKELFEEHARWIASLFSGFSEGDRQHLSRLLGRVRANIELPASAHEAEAISP
ncbi:MarR family winged helix-turn-helix transcriptional regulator [Methylosinus sp. Sm6]|uniref:MarR family winged helix-turn-helix transcriptional regulator n=1 Tax=Methylosinus sp. Sm6 TaxID=2866948 RepID=UPI001C9A09B7|nr:MarR family transcriptional regulator [Methylosinus sp. Sm6]MBY6239604.1 MarR family transcriptional regulator [Methylosinus sp. Sm6]